ncbi:MAG: two-component regulator propeller domain-containing protein, partial [Steroidobacteraceae bacterium]
MRRLHRLVWRTLGTALALSLCVVPLSARVPVPAVRPLYFEHLSTHDGLSQSTVMSMFQDSQGYLWLGTESGLDRYDGNSIREYRRERGNAQALASDYIWSIAEDAHGDLWLATDGGGVERWDRHSDRFQQFRHDPLHPETLASDAVRTLLIDSQGRIWAGTLNQGLDVLDPRTGVARHFRHREGDPRSLASDAVLTLYADRAGQIWVGSSGGLSRYEPESDDFVSYASLNTGAARGGSDLQVRAIHEDRAGVFWLGTVNGGLIRFEPVTGRSSVFRHNANDPGSLSQDRVWSILEDDGGRLWVATADGLNLMDRQAGTFAHYRSDPSNPQSLRDSDVLSLYQDRGGILWVGTRSGGASHWNPRSWQLGHYTSAAFRDTQVSSFADDGAGTLWVGTIGGGLIEIDTRSGHERHYGRLSSVGPHLSDDRVMALRYEPRGVFKGVLWVGTMSGGLDRIDLSTGAIRNFKHDTDKPNSLPADGVMSLYEDRLGTLWVGTFGGGLASIERITGRVTCYPYGAQDALSLANPRVSAIAEDGLGNLWIGTTGGGLDLLDRHSGQFYHYRRADRDPNSLSDDTVYALFVDGHGQVWVGTAGGGLDRVMGSSAEPAAVRFENQAGNGGLASQVIYGIEADRAEHLWLSTNSGLARFDPASRAVRSYHEAQGLQGEEFNFNAHYQSADGVLYFGGNNGFNAFAPDALTLTAPAPRVVLTGAAKLNHAVAAHELPGPDRPLQLAYDDKLLTLDFAALDFTSPASNRYAYKLDGFDAGWVDAGSQHRATYTNLDAGNYVFRVRAANADGVWSYVALAIPVHVAPAPWNTLAARLAYAALLCCLLGYFWREHRQRREHRLQARLELEGIVRSRTHELEERNQELQVLSRAKGDFVARMSHELRTPMNGVLGMTSLMLDTNLDATQRRFAEAIHRSADSLLGIVDDVLDFSKIEAGRLQLDPTECDLAELAEQTMEMLAARAASKDLELLVDLPPRPLPRVRVDSVRLRQVLVNLGGNAVKFTERGEVALRLVPLASTPAEFRMRLEVADTGPGIAPENQARIFEEFAQEDASTTRRFGGTGLGLAISRQIVELMGGELKVASAPGVGSIFSFELSMPVVEAELPAPWSSLEGRRVLVADGHAATRALLSQALMSWQVQPRIVASLEEALAQLRGSTFDVLLVDDGLLGDGAVERFRRELAELRAGPWIIRLTGFGTVKSAAGSALA